MVEIGTHDNGRGLEAELQMVKAAYPRVYEYIQELQRDPHKIELPQYDDNDEVVTKEE